MAPPANRRTLFFGSALVLAGLLWSGWNPHDRLTWLMEVLPVMLVLPLLWLTHRRFPLTELLLIAIFLHCAVLMLGGAYTYARVPLGFTLQDLFGLARNPYDRIGHFFQGLVPALAARELYIRHAVIEGRGWRVFLVLCTVLAISAAYELIEWAAALIMGQGADQFLGTQGDVWDTQSDMFMALLGAITALALFARIQDRQIAALAPETAD